jgi:hypothetical protein
MTGITFYSANASIDYLRTKELLDETSYYNKFNPDYVLADTQVLTSSYSKIPAGHISVPAFTEIGAGEQIDQRFIQITISDPSQTITAPAIGTTFYISATNFSGTTYYAGNYAKYLGQGITGTTTKILNLLDTLYYTNSGANSTRINVIDFAAGFAGDSLTVRIGNYGSGTTYTLAADSLNGTYLDVNDLVTPGIYLLKPGGGSTIQQLIINYFNQTVAGGAPSFIDLNGDGIISGADLGLAQTSFSNVNTYSLLANYPGSSYAVPYPTTSDQIYFVKN